MIKDTKQNTKIWRLKEYPKDNYQRDEIGDDVKGEKQVEKTNSAKSDSPPTL